MLNDGIGKKKHQVKKKIQSKKIVVKRMGIKSYTKKNKGWNHKKNCF